ncbi:MAG: 30S ribosomal protein S9 [SAR202 cluster bacterium]|nr:30S ribosomal protein S9 [SAR202 cluster bacterium]
MTQQSYFYGTGRRKSAVARVRLYRERGPIVINGKPLEEYLGWESWRQVVNQPFKLLNAATQFRVVAKVDGGGPASQAGALRHGIARALLLADPANRAPLKKAGFLTRDARAKESKKYGLRRARKAKQYTKR